MKTILEVGIPLSYDQLAFAIKHAPPIQLSPVAKEKILNCRNYLDSKLADGKAVFYGINTGFGSLCNTVISPEELTTLQENLLLSHACGTGDKVPVEIIRIMLLLKIQSLSFGHSGVQLETVERLVDFYNLNILPVVFEQGSLGASGDLAPLAHLCLPLIGYGKVWIKEGDAYVEKEAAEVLNAHNLKPIKLKSKEGLALINGTQFMSAYALYILLETDKLTSASELIAAASADGFDARIDPYQHRLHAIRPHPGQIKVAERMIELLSDSEIAAQPKLQVQDPYAFRCIPQVHGASYDTIAYARQVIHTEVSSVTDNPNIFPEEDIIASGGNFHGQPLALILDFLAIALAELGNISERRTYQLISGQRNLPAFLTAKPGVNSGFMIPQYTAASIVSQNKQLCTPASVDSIVSSNGQEDHVSMGANAATKCLKVLKNVFTIYAIEWMNAAQALEFRKPLKSGKRIEGALAEYRKHVPALGNDRYLHDDIQKTNDFIRKWNY